MDIAARRATRDRYRDADNLIDEWDRHARRTHGNANVPPIEASADDLAISSTAQITVSVEWLAYILGHAHHTGAVLVEGIAFAHRWDNTTSAHTVAGRILNVIAEQRRKGA